MNDEHFERVLAFNDDQRYAYFVAHACDDRAVYGLADGEDDWLVWGDAGGDRDVFPVWPHPRLALALAEGELDGFNPAGTDLEEFLRFLDDLQAERDFRSFRQYGRSKTATMALAFTLDRRWRAAGRA